MYLFQTI